MSYTLYIYRVEIFLFWNAYRIHTRVWASNSKVGATQKDATHVVRDWEERRGAHGEGTTGPEVVSSGSPVGLTCWTTSWPEVQCTATGTVMVSPPFPPMCNAAKKITKASFCGATPYHTMLFTRLRGCDFTGYTRRSRWLCYTAAICVVLFSSFYVSNSSSNIWIFRQKYVLCFDFGMILIGQISAMTLSW